MHLKLCSLLLILYFCHVTNGASILALFSSLSFADHLVFRGYVSLLAQRGHSVVVMTPYPGHFAPPEAEKIVELDVGEASGPFWAEYRSLKTNNNDNYTKMRAVNEFAIKLVIAQLKSKQMQALFINPNVKFDLVITEAEVPVLYALADKYNAPHIGITCGPGSIGMYDAKGCPTHPLFYPDVNTVSYQPSGLWQQLSEVNRFMHSKREYYGNYLPLSEVTAQRVVGLKRSLQEVERDMALLLVAANPALVGNRPTTPTVAYVDRMHIKPGLPLQHNIKTILDSAEKGVVLFSIGALQEPEELSPKLLKTFTEAFKELPYTFLWKISNASAIEKVDNVITRPWFPQQEVLGHPNLKAFITHGGPRSLEETIFYEVPIVGVPMVSSMKTFISQVTGHSAGELLDPYSLDKETLKKAITKVVTDTKYKNSMKALKHSIFDSVVSGPEHAVWWTEYVLRNPGRSNVVHYLGSAAAGASFYQYSMISTAVYLFLTLALFAVMAFYAVRYLVKYLMNKFYAYREGGNKFKAL